ncbi:hypothetical protein Lser_V15G05967 [Lactuca serriola]
MEWEEDSDEYIRKNLPYELYSDGQQHVNEEEVVGEAFEVLFCKNFKRLMNGKWIVDDNLEYSGHTRHMGDFNYPRLAYFVAATSGSNKVQCQKVLEELDVSLQTIET